MDETGTADWLLDTSDHKLFSSSNEQGPTNSSKERLLYVRWIRPVQLLAASPSLLYFTIENIQLFFFFFFCFVFKEREREVSSSSSPVNIS
jgi:hypothetical protein